MQKKYISVNGTFKSSEIPVFKADNRALMYGDAVFETMFSSENKIPLFNLHLQRLTDSMKILQMEIPKKFDSGKKLLFSEITRLINRNKHYKGARVRLTVYRNSGGLYTPENKNVSYFIQTYPLSYTKYKLNKTGITVEVFDAIKKPQNILSNLKTTNTLLYIVAGNFKKEMQVDDILLINENNHIAEALSSNIFLVKNEIITTPKLSEGCVNGVMRKKVIELIRQNNIALNFNSITKAGLLSADEVFLTNSISGIKWVLGYRKKRYYNKMATHITGLVNKSLFS